MRVCQECGVEKPLDKFRERRGWYMRTCRPCQAKKILPYRTAWRRANGVQVMGSKAQCDNGHARIPENLRPGRRDCAVCHREQEKARQHARGVVPYVKRTVCKNGHPLVPGNVGKGVRAGRCLLCHRMRETRAYDATAKQYVALIVTDPCSYCNGPGKTIDHITPVASGGGDNWDNLTSACHSCNARKRTTPLVLFLAKRRLKAEEGDVTQLVK